MGSAALNSVMTISRAKYGKRLTQADYRAMAGMKTVAEVTGYLKSKTRYASALSSVNELSVHRGNIEILLKNYNLEEIYRMCRFESAMGAHLFSFVIDSHEIKLLIDFLICFSAGKTREFIARMPMAVNKFSSVDFNKLCGFKNAEELSGYLSQTKYGIIANDVKNIEETGFTTIESKLYRMLYDTVFEDGADNKKGNSLSVNGIILMQAELYDFMLIYRAKRYYGCSPIAISSLVMNKRCLIPKKVFKQMIDSKTADEVLELFSATKYCKAGRRLSAADDIGSFCKRILLQNIKKPIHFSSSPAVVMLAYILYSEKEVDNIINIIEGVRYGLPPEEILENACIPDFKG